MVGRRRGVLPPPRCRGVTRSRSQSQVDRISALPDDLLHQILTRLRCTRTAARTGLLAHRWCRVWTGLLEVFFRGLAPDAIHAALAQVTSTSLEAIDIHVSRVPGHGALDAGRVISLLHAAARRSPVKLVLTIPVFLYDVDVMVDLPRFNSATSIELAVRNVPFALSAATEFPALETLSLSGCIMDLATLVPRCPQLRVLSVTSPPGEVDTITVHSASLQELVVSMFRSKSTIDIVAPMLRKLTLDLSRDIDNSLSVVAPMVEEVSFRGLAPDAIHAALTRVTCTSLLAIDIHVSSGTGHCALDASSVTNLLHAAADQSPVKLALTIPVVLCRSYSTKQVELPRLDFATSIELDVQNVRFALSVVTEFPKLETLFLSGCIMDLATLVPCCPRLRVLSVTRTPDEVDTIMVHSASLQELFVSTFRSTSTIDIVAPVLRKLALDLSRGIDNSLSVVAPMVEEVTWRCSYYSMYLGIGKMWRVCSLKVRAAEKMELSNDDDDDGSYQPCRAHVLSLDILEKNWRKSLLPPSVLQLKIATWTHVLGPLLLNLIQICTAVQRLDIVLVDTRVQVTDPCGKWCPCQESNRSWRKTANSLMDFTEVQIKGFIGNDEEINFLKLLFRCAPMLETLTLELSDKVTDDWYNVFLDTVQEYPYVNSSVCSG